MKAAIVFVVAALILYLVMTGRAVALVDAIRS